MTVPSAPSESIPVLTIDGPTASGKGTVAEAVGARLGFHVLDSGALYRLVALEMIARGVASDDEAALADLATALPARFAGGRIELAGRDVTDELRREDVAHGASSIAVHPAVRAALLQRQRDFRRAPGLVADGRDMGTTVFPDARLKVYLTASAEARALRRYNQLIEKGFPANIAALLEDLRARDARDVGRKASPLRPADDAFQLDSSDLTPDEVVSLILDWYGRPALAHEMI